MSSSAVDIQDNRHLRRVEAHVEDGDLAGFTDYRINPDGTWEFFHTEVDERFSGQGVGGRLVAGALDVARGEGVRVVPTCDFVRSYMTEREETHDLLAEGASLDSE